MTNAAGAQRVVIGVFEENLVELMAQTLVEVRRHNSGRKNGQLSVHYTLLSPSHHFLVPYMLLLTILTLLNPSVLRYYYSNDPRLAM